ncbi:uncharacterized protein EDB91DRAFT_1083295 [Suillus paluster]|uniref:uncharacterized protein n=1 Tax=Suillus paluster TaxID=48578 RepID=UPI001B883FE9|nr:uncharacterized protein EDB91DRAFT_1083295 [Suillus paluster]KAG1736625.1 hypothetical protein EDB91DRAFT_1083295 [Suillus paluster]
MSKNLQSTVLMILLTGKHWIFDDKSGTLEDVFGLDEKMFEVLNPHLTNKQRKSLCAMIEAVSQRKSADARHKVLEGKSEGGWSAGRNTLKIWFNKQKISLKMAQHIDNVWDSLGLLPLQLIQEGLEEGKKFPNILDSEHAKEDMLIAILGDHTNEPLLHGDFCNAATTINHHAWERHCKHFKHAQDSLPRKRLTASVAIKAIEDADEVSVKMFYDTMKAVKALRMTVAWFPQEDDHVAEYEEFLKEVIVTVIAKSRKVPKEKVTIESEKTPGRQWGAVCVRKVKAGSLTAAGDVEEIWALYLEVPWVEDDDEPSGRDDWNSNCEDLGMDGWREMDNDTLNHLLQFPGGKPPLFAKFRSKNGLCAWDEEKEGNTPGILIADEVGVGKTALTMGTIAFAIDAYWVQRVAAGRGKPAGVMSNINLSNLHPAPILGSQCMGQQCGSSWCMWSPWGAAWGGWQNLLGSMLTVPRGSCGRAAIPNLPHVIVVLKSLINQWYSKLHTFFVPRAVEIYKYLTAEIEFGEFWNGPWATLTTPFIHRIILVTHSVMGMGGKVFDTRQGVAGHNSNKVANKTQHLKLHKQAPNCLWAGHEFLMASIDEVHEMRNRTASSYVALEVTKASIIKLLSLGTLLYTGPMVHHMSFLDLCNVGRLVWIPHFMGKEGDEHDKEHTKQLQAKINDMLKPYKMLIFPVHLDETELEINMSVMAQITGSSLVAALDYGASFNMVFYLDGHTKVAFPHHTSPMYPTVKSLTEWDKVKDKDASTKAGESAKVLSPPPALIEKDAQPHETPTLISLKPNARYVPMKDLMTKGTHKILVYIKFPMMAPLLVSVLKLFNIIPLVIHGGHGIEECNETVQKFHSDPKDQCWSRMLVNQIIGQAWCLGQQREEGTSRMDMSQQSKKTAVRLWRYCQNTDFLAPPPYVTNTDLQMVWDHHQLIPTPEKPQDSPLQ